LTLKTTTFVTKNTYPNVSIFMGPLHPLPKARRGLGRGPGGEAGEGAVGATPRGRSYATWSPDELQQHSVVIILNILEFYES